MMQALFPSFRNCVCLFPQFTHKEIKDTEPHRRHLVIFFKGMICLSLNNCPLQADFCPLSPLSDLICAYCCDSATSTSTQDLHWKMPSSSFWNTDVSLPLALYLLPGCIRPAKKFWFRHSLFSFENTRNYTWPIWKEMSCSYRGCQEQKFLLKKLPFYSISALLWQLVGGSEILKVHFTVVLSMEINKNSPRPRLEFLHGIPQLSDYSKFQPDFFL